MICSAGALAQTAPSASASQKNPPADAGATGSPHRTNNQNQPTTATDSGLHSSTPGTDANSTAPRTNQAQPTTATGSGLHSGTASADADAAREINAQNKSGLTSGVAGAPTGRDTMKSDKLAWMDRRFVHKVAEDGKSEMQLAELAAQRASHAEVKAFAQKLVEGHTTINSELMTIAGEKNVKLDDDNDKSRAYKMLSKKSGHEFDQEFVEHMIDEHEKCIRMFEKASTDAKDSDVRAFAAKHLDHLRGHLQEAQSLRQAVIPTGRMDDSSGRNSAAGPTGTNANPGTDLTPKHDSSATPSGSTPAPYPKR